MKVSLCYANSEERTEISEQKVYSFTHSAESEIFTHSSALGQLEERRVCFVGILKKKNKNNNISVLNQIYNTLYNQNTTTNKYYYLFKKKKLGMFIPHWLCVSSVCYL